MILTSTKDKDRRLKVLLDLKLTAVTFGRHWQYSNSKSPYPNLLWVDVAGNLGIEQCVTGFYEKGARNIGFIGWPISNQITPKNVNDDRYLGWKQATNQLNLPQKNLAFFGNESIETGQVGLQKLLRINPDLDAVVCVSDSIAFGAILTAKSLNLNNLLISGFDNSPISKEFNFTSVDQNLDQVAGQALNLLLKKEIKSSLIEPKVIFRYS